MVVTAGPSRESIDPVRFVSNHSSGKMGYAIAEAAVSLGAETTLISGPVALTPPTGARVVPYESTDQLREAVVSEFPRSDCLIMAAAPADYRPAFIEQQKIKRGNGRLTLNLEPTTDILKAITSAKRPGQVVVGFALETDNALENARRKLREKRLDVIVMNQVGEETGFNSDTNQVTILRPRCKPMVWPLLSKFDTAARLLDLVARML